MSSRKRTLNSASDPGRKAPKPSQPLAHFELDLSEEEATALKEPKLRMEKRPFGRLHVPEGVKAPGLEVGLDDIPSSLRTVENLDWESDDPRWQAIHGYQDVHYPIRASTSDGSRAVMDMLALHVLGHATTTRARVLANNERLARPDSGDLEARDQGLARPKTLVLLPLRSSALRFVEALSRRLFTDTTKEFITNKKRFMDEFAVANSVVPEDKPRDYQELFAGNSDDCFRLGIAIAKKSLKLFVDFYSADILIASPLGLRMAIGAEGETSQEWDFLSSIQILILDQADLFLMQNWAHVLHIFEHLHRQPKKSRGTDLSRVRQWELSGWGQLYRQTLLFSSRPAPELRALHTRFGLNYRGLMEWNPVFPPQGLLPGLPPGLPLAFHRFSAPDLAGEAEARFNFFLARILPRYTSTGLGHTCIFVPSYLDFVRLRNHFKRETLGSVQISEYTKPEKVSRARDMFFHGKKPFLLYSERAHFFKRHHLRGIRQLIFYQLPLVSQFVPEMVELVAEEFVPEMVELVAEEVSILVIVLVITTSSIIFYQLPLVSQFVPEMVELVAEETEGSASGRGTCVALFTESDALRLCGVLGTANTRRLLSSQDAAFAFENETCAQPLATMGRQSTLKANLRALDDKGSSGLSTAAKEAVPAVSPTPDSEPARYIDPRVSVKGYPLGKLVIMLNLFSLFTPVRAADPNAFSWDLVLAFIEYVNANYELFEFWLCIVIVIIGIISVIYTCLPAGAKGAGGPGAGGPGAGGPGAGGPGAGGPGGLGVPGAVGPGAGGPGGLGGPPPQPPGRVRDQWM